MPFKSEKKDKGTEEFYFDELEIKIIKKFFELKNNEQKKTWDIMIEIFNPKSDYEKRIFYKKLINRLKGMSKLGIFNIKENKKNEFFDLIEDRVIFKKIEINAKKPSFIGIFACDKWHFFELPI